MKPRRPSLDNLILTDYLEFRYYLHGQQHMQVNLATVDTGGKIKSLHGADAQLAALFDTFLTAQAATIGVAEGPGGAHGQHRQGHPPRY
ncbi:MAG: hypothetical protein AMK72_01070 [Planctomycetes bacterium SM23_25]|nr:MAG: hypothetical protein AMK72_01070 [Planctomycetes bacterium SM23_25]